MNLRAVRLQLHRQDGEFGEMPGREGRREGTGESAVDRGGLRLEETVV